MQGCEDSGAMKAFMDGGMDEKAAAKACTSVRNDGSVSEISGDYTETLARIEANKQAVGVFGLAFYEQNQDKLKVATINDIDAVGRDHRVGRIPGVASAVLLRQARASRRRSGPVGIRQLLPLRADDRRRSPTVDYGLVALPAAEREEQVSKFEKGATLGSKS